MDAAKYITNDARVTALAQTFPTLRDADGVFPWDPEKLDAWARRGRCHGAILSAQFVLALWHGRLGHVGKPRKTPEKDDWSGIHRFPVDTFWRCGLFDVVSALTTWDEQHRTAFLAWAKDPWWP